MCLDKLLKDVEITETVGYKVFDTKNGKLSTAIQCFEVEVGKEYEAESGMISCFNPTSSYQSGFHIFLKLEDAKNYMEGLDGYETCVICKVSFRNILAVGLDFDMLCVVAQYMTVLDDPCNAET